MKELAGATRQAKPQAVPAGALTLQRRCACGGTSGPTGECAESRRKRLQRRGDMSRATRATVPPIVNEVVQSPGQPLDTATRAYMEPRFGHDFGNVRVHAGARAAHSADAVNALAYTVGPDIVIGAGRYAPATQEGSGPAASRASSVGSEQDPAESEADLAADRVVAGREGVPPVGSHAIALRRQAAPEPSGAAHGSQRSPPTAAPSGSAQQYPDCDRQTSGAADPAGVIKRAKATAIAWTNAVIPMIGAVLTAPESWQGTVASEHLDRHFHCPSDEQLDYIRTTLQAIGALLPELPLRCTNDPALCRSSERYYPVPITYQEVLLCPEYFTMSANLRAENLILRAANMLGRQGECYRGDPCYTDFSIPASTMVNNGTNYAYFALEASGERNLKWPATIPCASRQPSSEPPEELPPQPQRLCQEAGRPTSRTVVFPRPPRRPFVQVGYGPASGRLLEERHDSSGNFVCDRGRRIDQTW